MVHGSDGLDEITTAGPTAVAALENGAVRTFEITPEDVGTAAGQSRKRCAAAMPQANAAALQAVLEGSSGAYRDVAVFNAAAALVVAGKAKTLTDGIASPAMRSIPAKPRDCLERLIAVSNG